MTLEKALQTQVAESLRRMGDASGRIVAVRVRRSGSTGFGEFGVLRDGDRVILRKKGEITDNLDWYDLDSDGLDKARISAISELFAVRIAKVIRHRIRDSYLCLEEIGLSEEDVMAEIAGAISGDVHGA